MTPTAKTMILAAATWLCLSCTMTDGEQGPRPFRPDTEVIEGRLDFKIKVPEDVFSFLQSALSTRRIEQGPISLDFGDTSSITLTQDLLTFEPPIKVRYNGPGRLGIGTTVTHVKLLTESSGSYLLVDVDMSPIDLEIRPSK